MNDRDTVSLLKGLIVDGVNQANSGHPGGALSSADIAYILFSEFLNFDPNDPSWLGRDRFILSAGHESMLLYSLLFAANFLSVDDLKNFRRLHSRTPGHPENTHTPGVECTTGPLGQGAAMSVGFALAAKHFAATLSKELFSYKTYALLGDGCMQEDVTLGAASLAAHLGLNNLIWFYDKNSKQISGDISRATSVDEAAIFKGLGWDVLHIDGHDHEAVRKAISEAKTNEKKPTLVIAKTIMAKDLANLEGSHHTHGAPLSKEELHASKIKWGIPEGESFYWPAEAAQHFQREFKVKAQTAQKWRNLADELSQKDASFKKKFTHSFIELDKEAFPLVDFSAEKAMPTRNAFGKIIAQWAQTASNLIGGSADLEPSNMTEWFAEKVGDFTANNPQGRNLAFGVREFPMAAISNGIALHGGLVPFDATFLVFSDYARPALRLGALQQARVIHEFTHDSFYLGEDGPTHQPIEHLMALRGIPDFLVMRPADAQETAILTRQAVFEKRPSAICLSRQKLPSLQLTDKQKQDVCNGGYILHDAPNFEAIIIATGSEVSLALEAIKKMPQKKFRIVSLPCWELFAETDPAYQNNVLPPNIRKRIAIEAGTGSGWQKYVNDGLIISMERFGASANADDLAREFGFTAEAVQKQILDYLD